MRPGLGGKGIKATGSNQPGRTAPAPLERTPPQHPKPATEAEMLCHLHLQPPSHRAPAPSVGPLRTLWPQPNTVFSDLERQLQWKMDWAQELMSSVQQLLLGEGSSSSSTERKQSASVTMSQGADGAFAVCQDVKDFAPGELTVKLVGRKVLLTGKKVTQSKDSKGSFSYKYEVFKREWDVPKGVDPNSLTCSVSSEGQLRIKAPCQGQRATPERNVPIHITPAGSPEAEAMAGCKKGTNDRAKA
ncbi:heat shock protein beta-11-like [Alligator sinensis]|uniref:Heat shock protein beta-11-like n=1 Tax=Alligator sinensis TaxID=38654 RepID=A0A1U7SC64_ALLSI|nr:heat shock protein beta-11-like [Alligator sinensis]